MKSKYLYQTFILLAMLFSSFSTNSLVLAKSDSTHRQEVIVTRTLTYWDATYSGNVDANRFEKWDFELTEANNFTITATPTSGNLVPMLTLMDANGNEISTRTGSLTSNQPAGSYSLQIQPESGTGAYDLTFRKTAAVDEVSVTVEVNPSNIIVGETSVVSVELNNVPASGFTSAEFTCSINPNIAEISGIADAGLFGTDAVMVVNGPQNGSFILAIAGSNGNKATTSGTVFTFNAKGLQAGQISIECTARVSSGDNTLVTIPSTPATVNITENGTLAGQVNASKPVTIQVYKADNTLVTSATAGTDGTFSFNIPAGTYTVTATAEGFLSAQGTPTITSGATTTLQTISLLAGDIDNNGVIDQFDAMTVGMSYNTATPSAADLNNDGTINVLDLELLAGNYHKSGALAWQ